MGLLSFFIGAYYYVLSVFSFVYILFYPITRFITGKFSKNKIDPNDPFVKIGTYKRKGTNFSGKICVFRRGGGNKKNYRLVDFYRRLNAHGLVCQIQYDPSRSAYIGLILYQNGLFSYIILAQGVSIGSRLFSGTASEHKFASNKSSSLILSNIPLLSIVNNIETRPFFGASLARAAGIGATLVSRLDDKVVLKLKSG